MRTSYLLLAIAITAVGCSDERHTTGESNTAKTAEAGRSEESKAHQESSGFWQKLVIKEFRDNTGTVIVTMPFPSDWSIPDAVRQGEPSITGPVGLKVTDFPAQSFMDNYDPGLQQSYYQSGQRLRGMPRIDQLIQEDFVPQMAERGYQLVTHYEIPEVSKMDKWYSDQLYKAMPSRSEITAIGTDWKSEGGRPYFLLIHLNVSTSQTMQTWYYTSAGLEASPAHHERAKKQYIFALANARYNLQPIMAYNEQEAQRVGQSWAAHNQRMAQNQAAFEASQRAHVNKTNAINDAIMSGWRESNAASDRSQERTIDGIYERTNTIDPTTGEGYKVAAGANQYWMNSNGEYIGTQRQDYNPNLDDNMNEQRWRELKDVKR